ncbi:EamA family transporter RarD [Halodurantibacterium flavum]|uniref:EamA family transporter RarD n=1 Tax=Halodurantibacterium flavum TaxID=1382802 RepID=A0ABW4S354_9RHOB
MNDATPGTLPENADTPAGFAYALAAYLMWGALLPIYMKALSHVPAVEVIAHRVVWSLPIAAAVLIVTRRMDALRVALASRRTLAMAAVTATLVSANWGIYVWAIGSGHALDAALGYYINPLFSVLLGAVLLRESLGRLQIAALCLAGAAVLALTLEGGRVPWVALGLTLTWGLYAYFKKSLPVGPNQGFFLEVLLLTPPALIWIIWLTYSGQSHFGGSSSDVLLLIGCGLVTAVPLITYANAAKLLRLSTIGIMQYIAPTMVFLTAIVLFGEPLDRARMIAFPLIWAALLLYSLPLLRQMRRA